MTLGGVDKLANGAGEDKMDVDEKQPEADPMDSEEEDKYKPEATLRFELKNFTDFAKGHDQQRLSPPQYVRGLPWKVLAIPRENNRGDRRTKALGFFLQCNADAEQPSWTCSAQAVLRVLSQKEGIEHHERKISHTFYPKENDWGYSQFLSCDQLLDPDNGYIKDDTIILEVYVNADAPHGVQWDSKKHTGYIGLKNQGATCYMNSLLQTLFFTNKLRRAVYQMPTERDDPQTSVGLAMQRVFYELQHSDRPVGTKKLTRSFGWDTFESFLQHDVQELCRVLLDNLESKMKGTLVEGTIPKLFEGRMKSYIRCKNVDFESSREEAFYDVQLNIKGKKNIHESFNDYIETEMLDGDNKYDAGDYGMQPAEKGVKFLNFPPILHLQLMRFQYDPLQDANVKINDRYEFPEVLDLSGSLQDKEAAGVKYILHAVLVHSGDFHGGHYVVFINTNPRGNGRWCKFDDDVVSRATVREAVHANYGGEEPEMPQRAFTNAYMLVYIRQSCLNDVLCPVTDRDIPQHLKDRFEEEKEQDLSKKKEKQDAHLYITVNVINEEVMTSHKGFDLFDPELAETMARKFKIEKKSSIGDLYSKIATSYGLKAMTQFRLWHLQESPAREESNRMGPVSALSRLRPSLLITPEERDEPSRQGRTTNRNRRVEAILSDDKNMLFIEVAMTTGALPKYDDNTDMLVFLKYYDPKNSLLSFVGHVMVNYQGPLRPYLSEMCRRAHIEPNTELLLFEEVAPDKVQEIPSKLLDKNVNACDVLSEVSDGAIIVFQRADLASNTQFAYPTALKYMEKLYNEIDIEAIDNNNDADTPPVTGRISQIWRLEEFLKWLGEQISYDWEMIQLWRTSPYNDKALGPVSFERSDQYRLVRDILGLIGALKHDPRRDRRYRIYYTKMPVRVDELDRRKQMKLQWMDSKMNVTEITVFPDKTGSVKTILDEVRKQVQLAEGGSGQLRMVFAGQSPHTLRVYSVLSTELSVTECAHKFANTSYTGRVEEIPLDQVSINTATEYLLPVGHFDKEPTRIFGVPFFIKVKQGESFSAVRDRIKKTLDVSDKEFEKYKFALVANNRVARYLDELSTSTVNLSELGHTHVTGVASQPWLGLDHMNKSRGARSGHTLEKAIVIHN